MSVKFTDDHGQSEEAVDLGGPRRELLTLVMLELQQSSLFANTPNGIGKLIDNFGPGEHLYISSKIQTKGFFSVFQRSCRCLSNRIVMV